MIRIFISVILFSTFMSACKKDLAVCKDYKEIKGRAGGIDPSTIQSKELRDTLLKYPQLEPYQTQSSQMGTSMNCRVYYQDLLVFSDTYSVFKNNMADTLSVTGTIIKTTLPISLSPKITHEDAIAQAKLYINLDHTCTAYELGLYNKNRWANIAPDYRLAWRISDSQNPYIYVIVDALNKYVLYSDRGIYFID